MGMFDHVQSEVPLPDGFIGELQSESFDCSFTTILIRADGRLLIKDREFEIVPVSERPFPNDPKRHLFGATRVTSESWRDLDFHGDFEFCGYEWSVEKWHGYIARFTNGQLQYIKILPASDGISAREPSDGDDGLGGSGKIASVPEDPLNRFGPSFPMTNQTTTEDGSQNAARTAEFQRSLLQRAGGALTVEQVRSLLGCDSGQSVREAVAARRLLAVDVAGIELFPAFQFDKDDVAPGIALILSEVPNTSPWAILQFFVEGDEGLGDDLPMDLIKRGPDEIARAARFARTMEV